MYLWLDVSKYGANYFRSGQEYNLAKHSLDFRDVELLDWERALIVPNNRHNYGEPRHAAFARMEGQLHRVSFTWRDGAMRVISFRRAREKEKQRYEKN